MKNLIPPNVNQEDILTWLLPIVCCVLMMAMTSGRSEKKEEPRKEVESWYTTQNIEETYKSIENETAEWRKKAQETGEKSGSFLSRLRGGLSKPKTEERFIVQETIPPKLYRMTDATAGAIYFELTEVEGGGTVVKATYNSSIKKQIAEFKAGSPLKIPAAPIGNRCPSCGKPVLPEFILCPYCGEKLMTKESS